MALIKRHFFQTVRQHATISMQFFCTLATVFAATPIRLLERKETHWELTLNLIGLTGVNSVLKQQALTEFFSDNELQAVHQWYYTCLYQAWSLYHWPVQSEKINSELYDHFLPYCQTNPRSFEVSYGDWGFCYPSLAQLQHQLEHHFPGTHVLQTTVGWVPLTRQAEPLQLGHNTLLGRNIPLSRCGLVIHSILATCQPATQTKAELAKFLAPWPKLWGLPMLEVHWSIQGVAKKQRLLLGAGRLGCHSITAMPGQCSSADRKIIFNTPASSSPRSSYHLIVL